MKIAFKEKKVKSNPSELEGQIALVFGFKNELASAKALYQFSEENPNLKI